MSSTSGEVAQTPQQQTLDLDGLMARGNVTQANLQEILRGADFIVGRALVKDKDTLLGCPFVITGVTFRNVTEGTKSAPPRDYASVEYITISNDPNQCVEGVFNDGSTGVRRQIVSYLQSTGAIDPTRDPDDAISLKQDVPDADGTNHSGDVPYVLTLVAPRGLRKSDYVSDATGEAATTYYLS